MSLPRGWNAWQLHELRRRVLAGEQYSVIGKAIGKTKDAAIGMSCRQGLPRRTNPLPPRQIEPPAPIFVPPPFVRRTCQWIEGLPSADDACKCGATALLESAYCAPHQERSVVRAKSRKLLTFR